MIEPPERAEAILDNVNDNVYDGVYGVDLDRRIERSNARIRNCISVKRADGTTLAFAKQNR